jgi:hypothetical protein
MKHYESVPSCYYSKRVDSAGIKDPITRHPAAWFHLKFLNSFQIHAAENYSNALLEVTSFFRHKFLSVISIKLTITLYFDVYGVSVSYKTGSELDDWI